MEDYFLKYLYTIYQNKKVPSSCLGISGGYDSILLLLVAVHIYSVSKQKFTIIHCNHIWQKDNVYMETEMFTNVYIGSLAGTIMSESMIRTIKDFTYRVSLPKYSNSAKTY